jgi:hypothetical protein
MRAVPFRIDWPAQLPSAVRAELDSVLAQVIAPADRRIRWTGRFHPYGFAGGEPLPLANPKSDTAVPTLRELASRLRSSVICYDSRLRVPEMTDALVAEIVLPERPPLHLVVPYQHRGILRTVLYGPADVRLHPAWHDAPAP